MHSSNVVETFLFSSSYSPVLLNSFVSPVCPQGEDFPLQGEFHRRKEGSFSLFFPKDLFLYFLERDREHKQGEGEGGRERIPSQLCTARGA